MIWFRLGQGHNEHISMEEGVKEFVQFFQLYFLSMAPTEDKKIFGVLMFSLLLKIIQAQPSHESVSCDFCLSHDTNIDHDWEHLYNQKTYFSCINQFNWFNYFTSLMVLNKEERYWQWEPFAGLESISRLPYVRQDDSLLLLKTDAHH